MPKDISPARESIVERVWAIVVQPAAVGVLLVASGGLLLTGGLRPESGVAWLDPIRSASIVPAAAGLMGAALILWLALVWQRVTRGDAADDTGKATVERPMQRRLFPALGGASAIIGMAFCIGAWFGVIGADRPGELILEPGAKAEYFQGRMAGESVKVMLPLRVQLDKASLQPPVSFEVAFSKPGGEPFGRRKLGAGESVSMEGYRLAPVGLSTEQGYLQATISSRRDDTIPATAGVGQTFKVSPRGASYTVEEIVDNYLGALGPAARLSSEKNGEFWVFARTSEAELAPDFEHQLTMDRLERAPAVVLAVTPKMPVWPVALGGCLFVVGLAACIAFPERIRLHDGSEDGEMPRSFNEAGSLAEAVERNDDEPAEEAT